jgi:hypothetical protein
MSTFAEKQAERKAAAAAKLASFDRQAAIAAHVPGHIIDRIEFVHLHGRGPVITFKADTLADAMEILDAFEPAKYYYLTGGTFGHVNPRQYIKPRDWESAKEEMEFCAPYIEAASGTGWTECKVKMFTLLDGFKMCTISIDIAKPGADWVPFQRLEINPATGRTRKNRYWCDVRMISECKRVTWSAGGADCARVTRHFTDLEMWRQFAERENRSEAA